MKKIKYSNNINKGISFENNNTSKESYLEYKSLNLKIEKCERYNYNQIEKCERYNYNQIEKIIINDLKDKNWFKYLLLLIINDNYNPWKYFRIC